MRRNRLYALAVLVTVAVVAGPALAGTVHSHARKHHASAKSGPRGPRGPRGARGPAGATGATGPAGAGTGAFERTIIVSPDAGANPSASGTRLLAALAGAAGEASASSPYLVWIEPGIYDIGTNQLNVPAHVDVQGSGQDVTTVQGEGAATLVAASGTELRDLTAVDDDPTGAAQAIATSGGLRDVTATATGAGAATAALANTPTMPIVNVTASATTSAASSFAQAIETQGAAQIDGGSYTATNNATVGQAVALFAESTSAVRGATLQASGGSVAYPVYVVASDATVTIDGSTLIGTGGFYVAPGNTLDVGASQIPGVVGNGAGTVHCPDDWLPDFATAGTGCS